MRFSINTSTLIVLLGLLVFLCEKSNGQNEFFNSNVRVYDSLYPYIYVEGGIDKQLFEELQQTEAQNEVKFTLNNTLLINSDQNNSSILISKIHVHLFMDAYSNDKLEYVLKIKNELIRRNQNLPNPNELTFHFYYTGRSEFNKIEENEYKNLSKSKISDWNLNIPSLILYFNKIKNQDQNILFFLLSKTENQNKIPPTLHEELGLAGNYKLFVDTVNDNKNQDKTHKQRVLESTKSIEEFFEESFQVGVGVDLSELLKENSADTFSIVFTDSQNKVWESDVELTDSSRIKHLNSICKKVESYLAEDDFTRALSLIKDNDCQKIDSILSIKVVTKQYANWIETKACTPDTLFSFLEDSLHISTSMPWYKDIKLRLLTHQYQKVLKNDPANHPKLIIINNKRRKLSEKYELINLELHGLLWYSSNVDSSIKYFNKYLARKNNSSHVIKYVRDLVCKEISSSYSKSNYQRAYNWGSKYNNYITNNFNCHLMYALSTFNIEKYSKATDEFSWILENWESNKLVSWDEFYLKYEYLTLYSLNFATNQMICKDLYREKKEQLYLDHYLISIRAKYLKILLNATRTFKGDLQSLHFQKKDIPYYIRDIFYTENNKTQSLVDKKTNIDIPAIPSGTWSDDYSLFIEGVNIYLSAKHNRQNLFSIYFTNTFNSNINQLLEKIKIDPFTIDPWEQIVNYEKEICQDFIVYSLARLIATEIESKKIKLADFCNLTEQGNYIEYVAYFDQNGIIKDACNYDSILVNVPNNNWKESLTTPLLYKQEVLYDGKTYNDISYPVIINNTQKGVLKIGFK